MQEPYKRKFGITIIIIVVILTLLFHSIGWFNVLDKLFDLWFWIASGLLGFGGALIGISRKTDKTTPLPKTSTEIDIDPNFVNLAVHYSRMKSQEDIPNKGRLRYVLFIKQKQAYKVPDWLNSYVIEHKISWRAHDNERAMKKFFEANNVTILDDDIIPQDLGLSFKNGILVSTSRHGELVSKLGGKKLENLLLIFLNRRNYFGSSTHRRLLIDFTEKQVWLSPIYDFELIEKNLIDFETKGMRPWESCKRWCKRKYKDFQFMDRRYPESKLLENS